MIHTAISGLLSDPVDALVNTVNCVGVMGKGVALQFKKAFPDNYKTYREACLAGRVRTGEMLGFDRGIRHPRWIINFPTKRDWRHPSRMEWIVDGLIDLIRFVTFRGIRSIAIPPLGCGKGGLSWAEVRPHIVAAFVPYPDIDVQLHEPL